MQIRAFGSALAVFLMLAPALLPSRAADPNPKRTPWDAARVSELAGDLTQQIEALDAQLRAAVEKAEAETEDPDMEEGVGGRTVVAADLAILGSRLEVYNRSLAAELGREQTKSLFGRIESLVSLTARDLRVLPDYPTYRANLESLEKTVAELAPFYAEDIQVTTPPDPLGRL